MMREILQDMKYGCSIMSGGFRKEENTIYEVCVWDEGTFGSDWDRGPKSFNDLVID